MSDKKDVYGWKYYRKGKLIRQYPNDIPETMEDAVIELQENGVDVSDCVDDKLPSFGDAWSPDYPPEEEEYSLTFQPLTTKECEELEAIIGILKKGTIKTSDDFIDKVWSKINKESLGPDWDPNFHVPWYKKCINRMSYIFRYKRKYIYYFIILISIVLLLRTYW